MDKPHLCWVGHIGGHTGLGRVSDNLLSRLAAHWRITVIAISQPSPGYSVPWATIIPAQRFQDWMGRLALRELWRSDDPPALVVPFMDPWVFAEFAQGVPVEIPMVGYLPVDGYNIKHARALERLAMAIFLADFALGEARSGGYSGPAAVIGHGVDRQIYRPIPMEIARAKTGLAPDEFIIGAVGQNQPRKKYDVLLKVFAECRHMMASAASAPARLYLHCLPEDIGWDLPQLITYYGLDSHVTLSPHVSCHESFMPYIYSSFNLQTTATWGEGFGLTTLEGMACGVPQVVPDHTALADWALGGAYMVPCYEDCATTGGTNILGWLVDPDELAGAWVRLARDTGLRQKYATGGLALAASSDFEWDGKAQQFHSLLVGAIHGLAARV